MNFNKYQTDTIVAIATPKGKAALAIIRVSGKDTFKIVAAISDRHCTDGVPPSTCWRSEIAATAEWRSEIAATVRHRPPDFRSPKRVYFHNEGELLDEGMLCLFKAPKSYTGEDMAELYCHGNDFIVNQILETLLKHCRLAQNGEFTLRRYLNKKIDLTQAESINDLINSDSPKSHKAALLQLEGKLYNRIKHILNKLTELRVIFELAIDFIEDEVPEYQPDIIINKIDALLLEMDILISSSRDGIIIRDGLKICLAGPPNVGKSSIFNAFLERERAIITPIPGTTRDFLEESFILDGYKIRLFDTAGLRESDDPIEKIGISRSGQIIEEADLVLYITDPETPEVSTDPNYVYVLNKTDLLKSNNIRSLYIPCSTITPNGLEPLKQAILSRLKHIDSDIESGIITNVRQLACLKKAYVSIFKAKEAMQNKSGIDFIAFDVQQSSNAIEEIIGKITPDDIINNIFENFCIGK